jgi:gamma-glutamyltranspeptidase/glutathione hydrolase
VSFAFPSRRSVVAAMNGMVATSQPLAAMAGLRVLLDGGNAADAAIATAAVLNVVEPMSTGVGGDAFALFWNAREKRLRALNASGRASENATLESFRGAYPDADAIPLNSWFAVTVPGAVDGWETLLRECGTMPLARVLAPAIEYAERGFPVSETIAANWKNLKGKLQQNPEAARVYLPPPRSGEMHRQPDLARTLRVIAEGGAEAFYRGEIAEKIMRHAQETGGLFTRADFAEHRSTWDMPISTNYRGVEIVECPPNGQGVIALEALNNVEGFDLRALGHNSAAYLHLLVEAIKLGFADAARFVADPEHAPVPTNTLVAKDYASAQRARIDAERAGANYAPGLPLARDTVYLTVMDGERNACSFINSLYYGFGSGIVVPGTGICLQNRGALFSLDPDHPNALAPRKRPYHTIIPAMAFRENNLWLSFGVMGGFHQPQGHLQVVCNLVDFGMDPQRALDAPRFSWLEGAAVDLEDAISSDVRAELTRRGHQIQNSEFKIQNSKFVIPTSNLQSLRGNFGGGQIIAIDPASGVLLGGSDPRKDGCAIGF